MTREWRQVQQPLTLLLGDPAPQRQAATAPPSCRHSRETQRCIPSHRITTTALLTATTTPSSIAHPLLLPPPLHLLQRGSAYWASPTQVLTSLLPLSLLLPPPPQPLLPHTITIITTTTTTTTPIITITPPAPPLLHPALPVLLPLMHLLTMHTHTAHAPLTLLWAPPPLQQLTLLPPLTPHLWASHFHIQAPPPLKCSIGWSERPRHQPEPTQRG